MSVRTSFVEYVVGRQSFPDLDIKLEGEILTLTQSFSGGPTSRVILAGDMINNLIRLIGDVQHEQEAHNTPATLDAPSIRHSYPDPYGTVRATSGSTSVTLGSGTGETVVRWNVPTLSDQAGREIL